MEKGDSASPEMIDFTDLFKKFYITTPTKYFPGIRSEYREFFCVYRKFLR
jgi:hypothetical protein